MGVGVLALFRFLSQEALIVVHSNSLPNAMFANAPFDRWTQPRKPPDVPCRRSELQSTLISWERSLHERWGRRGSVELHGPITALTAEPRPPITDATSTSSRRYPRHGSRSGKRFLGERRGRGGGELGVSTLVVTPGNAAAAAALADPSTIDGG